MAARATGTGGIAEKTADFRVFWTDRQIPGASFYFIESTAPDTVEERVDRDDQAPDGLTPIDPDQAVIKIAEDLTPEGSPEVDANLVVMAHGFNTPRDKALPFYARALEAIEEDKSELFGDRNRRTVCVAYRWPSERVGSILSSSIAALPTLPLFLLTGSVLLAGLCVWLVLAVVRLVTPFRPDLARDLLIAIVAVCGVVIIVIVVLALLRAIVYFRDVYRATNHGVPDLVEVIRQIDRAAVDRLRGLHEARVRPRIALSFIGHSMGGLVVTDAIRVLSDVFDPAVIRTRLSGEPQAGPTTETPGGEDVVSGEIGHVFTLMRFVLASPDIPAETLLSDRANFLASALRRFREAYLFSNEGDEVLRMISTTVNYFTFPTSSRVYGYRLGNVEILSSDFSEPPRKQSLMNVLRVGTKTLSELSGDITRGGQPAAVARAFTYFDCTDYKDGSPPQGMLTEALNFKRNDPAAHIPLWEHVKLLILYLLGRVDVHGGYFKGAVTQRLIYRLACLGIQGAAKAYGDEAKLLKACADSQIRVMLSDRLDRRQMMRERMSVAIGSLPAR